MKKMNAFQIFACVVILLTLLFIIFKFMFRNYGVPCPECSEFSLELWDEDQKKFDSIEKDEGDEEDVSQSSSSEEEEEEENEEQKPGPIIEEPPEDV